MEEEAVNKKAEEGKKKKRTSLKSILGGDILATDFFRRQTKLLVLIMVFIIFYIHNRYASQQQQIEIDRLKIKHKYINLHKKRGVDQGRELRINREVKNIIVKSSVEDLATALSVTGGYPEDSETPINLKGYKYDDGDIYLSGSTIYSRSAVAKWSRYLSEKGNGTGHIVQTYTYDTLSQSELCNRAVSKLSLIHI